MFGLSSNVEDFEGAVMLTVSREDSRTSTDRREWKEFAGRKRGKEGYKFGDITRGMLRILRVRDRAQTTGTDAMSDVTCISTSDDSSAATLQERRPRSESPRRHWPSSSSNNASNGPVRRLFSRSRKDTVPGPVCIDDLEPVTQAGKGFREWGALRPKRQPLSGRLVQAVPNESLLGEGSYGVVWRARRRQTKEIYAVKNIKLPQSSVDSLLAENERDIVERVILRPHPCIVTHFVAHYFSDIKLCSLIMEFCPGGDLFDRIVSARRSVKPCRMPYSAPLGSHGWIGQIFLALEHIHSIGLLFRDLKPDNVVFGADGGARLTDFGLGRVGLESSGRWTFGIPTGSPGYCAPEVLKQEQYDFRADFYSFGVLIWVLLTGGVTNKSAPQPPMSESKSLCSFEASYSDWSLLEQCIAEPAKNSARRLPDCAKALVQSLTKREPTARPAHCEIRNTSFMQVLQLPASDAPTIAIQDWVSGTQAQ